MASYTMTIAEMMNNGLTQNIFPTTYDFYLDDAQARKDFEDKFIKHNYYREIGFESPFMFIQKLDSHLILNMPYWKQLYHTELESRNINFLLNKDLLETVTHTVTESGTNTQTGTNEQTGTSEQSGENKSSATNETKSTETGVTSGKQSSLADGVAQASLGDGYLTGVNAMDTDNEATSNSTQSNSDTQTISQSQSVTQTQNINGTNTKTVSETNELVSKGNIGITSSAQLLKEWRDVLINMDEIIIESCNDLFMKIY